MRKREAYTLVFALIVIFIAGVSARSYLLRHDKPNPVADNTGYSTTVLSVGDKTFLLDVADTPAKQKLGLGGRTEMAANKGMIFPYYDSGQRCFWMKDMLLTIDIIWLDAQKKVGHIEKSLSPDTYPQTYCPDVAARYVVELTSGATEKAGIGLGDSLQFEL